MLQHRYVLYLFMLMTLLACQPYAVWGQSEPFVNLIYDPPQPDIDLSSAPPVSLAARPWQDNVRFRWTLSPEGIGQLDRANEAGAIYRPPASIQGASAQVTVTVTATDEAGTQAKASLTFTLHAGQAAPAPVEEALTPTPDPTPTPANTWTDPVTGMEFARMPAGCFQMGSPDSEEDRDSDEGPVHEVCLDEFWMGKYEVTQAQWQKIMGSNPSRFKGENRPVERVSWNDAQEFITQLNRQSGHTFRLPTEAEWEYAARGGTTTPFYFGETISTDQANYDGDYVYGHGKKGIDRGETTDVGSFPANAFDLYDMHGNVWEWCQDVYDRDAYKDHARHNPIVTSGGSNRVERGGSWYDGPRYARSASRRYRAPSNRNNDLGLRLVRKK